MQIYFLRCGLGDRRIKMKISKDFCGGNIELTKLGGDTVYLKNELRDTTEDWFYWAFCVTGAAGRRIKFVFDDPLRVGYYGAAVSTDLENWRWSGTRLDGSSFEYTFAANENKLYFAHDFLYLPERLYKFAEHTDIELKTLCKSRKGRTIPYFKFGSGNRHIVLTARHHACESTGSYVLEGLLGSLAVSPLDDTTIFCLPMMDYDGVCDGDQGKFRAPHDHAREYDPNLTPLYETTAAMRKYIDEHNVICGFDFHSPWHLGGINDKVFIVRRKPERQKSEYEKFGRLLADSLTADALKYTPENDFPPNTEWNRDNSPNFANYIINKPCAKLAFTLETCYFGEADNIFSSDKAIALGSCFAKALRRYLKND